MRDLSNLLVVINNLLRGTKRHESQVQKKVVIFHYHCPVSFKLIINVTSAARKYMWYVVRNVGTVWNNNF